MGLTVRPLAPRDKGGRSLRSGDRVRGNIRSPGRTRKGVSAVRQLYSGICAVLVPHLRHRSTAERATPVLQL